jgi:GntR family transcriptional repressor for pyruvate dehydrogenase complex
MTPIKKNKVADLVIGEMQRRLESGDLNEGDKLPNQSEFAAELGVSRTSLREALHTLSLLGAIEQRPGYGTVIKSRVPIVHADQLTLPMIADEAGTIDLIEARRFIELANVELAVKNASSQEIAEMTAIISDLAEALQENRVSDFMVKDMKFHYLIAKATHNQVMVHLYLTIQRLIEQFIQETMTVLPGLAARSLSFHRDICRAVTERDSARALSAMEKHILDIQDALGRYYEVAHVHDEGNGNISRPDSENHTA